MRFFPELDRKVSLAVAFLLGVVASVSTCLVLTGGIVIAIVHLIFGLIMGITIIGIPWAKQHFKLAALALAPFGREIIRK
jgi:uncharacterized membrane protein YccF (DUF307 family)